MDLIIQLFTALVSCVYFLRVGESNPAGVLRSDITWDGLYECASSAVDMNGRIECGAGCRFQYGEL